jgi:hypothetical protein
MRRIVFVVQLSVLLFGRIYEDVEVEVYGEEQNGEN